MGPEWEPAGEVTRGAFMTCRLMCITGGGGGGEAVAGPRPGPDASKSDVD